MGILMFMLNWSWKVLCVAFGWMLFWYIVKNGKGTMRNFLDTVSVIINATSIFIRKKLLAFIKRNEPKAKESDEMKEIPDIEGIPDVPEL